MPRMVTSVYHVLSSHAVFTPPSRRACPSSTTHGWTHKGLGSPVVDTKYPERLRILVPCRLLQGQKVRLPSVVNPQSHADSYEVAADVHVKPPRVSFVESVCRQLRLSSIARVANVAGTVKVDDACVATSIHNHVPSTYFEVSELILGV